MSICAWCQVKACQKQDQSNRPAGCPMNNDQWLKEALEEYKRECNRRLAQIAAHTEKTGYCQWPRLQEIAEFSRSAGYRRLGLAFCIGLQREAKIVADYFRQQGFEVISAVCCVGGVEKETVGIAKQDKFNPGGFEAMCNPIGQAKLMNQERTDFNVVLGLCVGHDSLFFRYSEAPVTVLAAKDRVLGHNPLAAVYCAQSYYSKLYDKE